jgi:hypothetical protein
VRLLQSGTNANPHFARIWINVKLQLPHLRNWNNEHLFPKASVRIKGGIELRKHFSIIPFYAMILFSVLFIFKY